MSLSEDIRLGALLYPQCDEFYELDKRDKIMACCAMGGAWLAAGRNPKRICYFDFFLCWPLTAKFANCPECHGIERVGKIIWWHLGTTPLFDSQCTGLTKSRPRWTRERIADWVQAIEQKAVSEQIGVDNTEQTVLLATE